MLTQKTNKKEKTSPMIQAHHLPRDVYWAPISRQVPYRRPTGSPNTIESVRSPAPRRSALDTRNPAHAGVYWRTAHPCDPTAPATHLPAVVLWVPAGVGARGWIWRRMIAIRVHDAVICREGDDVGAVVRGRCWGRVGRRRGPRWRCGAWLHHCRCGERR